jgi:hypothetical protein
VLVALVGQCQVLHKKETMAIFDGPLPAEVASNDLALEDYTAAEIPQLADSLQAYVYGL